MKGCPLVPADFGESGTCDWCGKDLPVVKRTGRVNPTRRWCGPQCSGPYWANHQWNLARDAALKRDHYKCVKCGSTEQTTRGTCWKDGLTWPCPDAGKKFKDPYWDRYFVHSEFIVVRGLEVNHIQPRKGGGYLNGCAHHLDGLETLCHPCHVEVTKQQLREWKYGAEAPVPDTIPLWEPATA